MNDPLRGLIVRQAVEEDAQALAAFECSTGRWYEDEVQDYVRGRALAAAHGRADEYRLLVGCIQDRLIAVAAHASEALVLPDYGAYAAARLQVLAISVAAQGRRLADGARLSDVLIATLIADAMDHRRTDVITAIVANDNQRSIALCERNGLRSQTRYSSRYVRLTGRLRQRV